MLQSKAEVIADSSLAQVKRFDRAAFNKLKNSKEFHYQKEELDASLIEKLLEWIGSLFEKLLPSDFPIPENSPFAELILWLLMILLAALLVYLALKLKFGNIFKAKPKKVKGNDFEIISEDIHAIEFKSELEQAEAENNYRKAIRLSYLKTLKKLDDKQWIRWSPGLTNTDFRNMMRKNGHFKSFNNLASIYEIVWYGMESPNLDEYTQIKNDFESFHQIIGGEEQ